MKHIKTERRHAENRFEAAQAQPGKPNRTDTSNVFRRLIGETFKDRRVRDMTTESASILTW